MGSVAREMIRRMDRDAREIFDAAVRAVQPAVLMDHVATRVWAGIEAADRVVVMAVGKAAASMTAAFLPRLGRSPAAIFVTMPDTPDLDLPGAEVARASHPVPDERSVRAARRALEIARSLTASDLLVMLASGGGSSLWAGVPDSLCLEDIRSTTEALLQSSVPIGGVNTVRRALSTIKGGRLAFAAYPARVMTLVLSDVPGDDPATIASGPTVPSHSDPALALQIVSSAGPDVPRSVLRYLEGMMASAAVPVGRPRVRADPPVVIGGNGDAVAAAVARAAALAYEVDRSVGRMDGLATEAGRAVAEAILLEPVGKRCLVYGGETVVNVIGDGKGGRNQELALSAAVSLKGADRPTVVLSAGTDGIDGPTDAAGAVVSSLTIEDAAALGERAEDYLGRNDSYTFFARVGGHIITGPTGTNVSDLQVALAGSPTSGNAE